MMRVKWRGLDGLERKGTAEWANNPRYDYPVLVITPDDKNADQFIIISTESFPLEIIKED